MRCEKKGKVPVQYAWVGRAGSLPPPTAPLVEPCRGGGRAAGQVLPGDFERGRGDLWQASRELKWQVFLASKFGGLFSRVNLADFHGKMLWRVILAHLFGGFSQEGKNKLLSKEEIEKKMYNQ
jgi:hypothetical protein